MSYQTYDVVTPAADAVRFSNWGAEKPKQRRRYAEIDVYTMMTAEGGVGQLAGTDADDRAAGQDCPGSSSSGAIRRVGQPTNDPVMVHTGTGQNESSDLHSGLHQLTKNDAGKPEAHESAPDLFVEPAEAQLKFEDSADEPLPRGWRKCEDDDGSTYFWHVRSGAVQRERPSNVPYELVSSTDDLMAAAHNVDSQDGCNVPRLSSHQNGVWSKPLVASEVQEGLHHKRLSDDHLSECEGHIIKLTELSVQHGEHTGGFENGPTCNDSSELRQRFATRSLGWLSLTDAELADAESSGWAVNRCIGELTSGRANGSVSWSDGKEIFLDIEGTELQLVDPTTMTVLCMQPVQSIRIWAISGQSPSDFAYVARDLSTRQLKCHVFRCDFAARPVTEALQMACSRAATERQLRSGSSPVASAHSSALASPAFPGIALKSDRLTSPTLPSPMEGPKKAIRCHYLGSTEVHRPTGIDVLNGAIEKIQRRSGDPSNWKMALVVVSPSMVAISESQSEDTTLAECRIRYLSFLGISSDDVKMCGFIVHSAEDEFIAHVFHCEPSAGALCKTIEAACKLRFQKCLDAQPDLDVNKMALHAASAASAGKVLQDTVKKGVQNILSKMWPSKKA